MSTLPQGWDFDYDGTRWFYKYKPTGHIQYHFPSEGDEFPDFVDAASPAPALAPEERLESQRQQVRRAASLNQSGAGAYNGGQGSRGGRDRSGMSAKATPVSYVLEEYVEQNEAYVAPESFMYLGPGTHLDVSPLPSEDGTSKRAGSSPGGNFLSPSDGRSRHTSPPGAQWALPAQSPRFSPYASSDGGSIQQAGFQGTEQVSYLDTTGAVHGPDGGETIPMLDGRETIHMLEDTSVVHMLDGREVASELPGITRFNPVGVVAEMNGDKEEDLVEMPAEEPLVPAVEGAVKSSLEAEEDVQVALRNLEEETTSRGSGSRPTSDPLESQVPTEAVGEMGPKPLTVLATEESAPQPTFKIARKPTSGKYQPYKAVLAADEGPKMSDEFVTGQTALRREDSLLMSGGEGEVVDSSPVPSALALRQKQPAEDPASRGTDTEKVDEDRGLVPHPSVLDPSKRSSREILSSSPAPSRSTESPIDPTVDPAGITKFPSVLRPARGRAPSIPPRQTVASTEGVPRKCYEQVDSNSGLAEEGDKKYKPYRGPQPLGGTTDTQRPFSDVQPTIETTADLPQASTDRPVTIMPLIKPTPEPEPQQANEERHLPYRLLRQNSAEVHQPQSISALDGGARPVAEFDAMPGLGFAAGGVPSPASSDATPPPISPPTKTVPPPASQDHEQSSTSIDVQQEKDQTRRRGSSVASATQSNENASTWTPSPASDTAPSIPQLVINQRRPSLLRHSVSYGAAEESAYDSDMTSHVSSNSNGTTPISAAPVSSTHSDSPAHFSAVDSIRRLSLPYSLLEDSDASPNTPPPPAKHAQRESAQRPRSRHGQTTPDSASSGPSPSVLEVPASQIEMGGHVLHAIEEDEEPPVEEKRVFMEGYSASSGSIQMTPPMIKKGDYFAMAPNTGAAQSPRGGQSGSTIAPQGSVQSPGVEELLRANRHSMQQNSHVAPVQSRQRSVSHPISPSAQGPTQFETMKTPITPLNRHDVPQLQLPPTPTLYHQQSTQMQSTPPTEAPHQWYLTMPAPGMSIGTTTQVSSPGQTQKERGWKKLFKKSPAKEAPPMISAPQPQPQPYSQPHPQGYFPMYQNHPNIQNIYQQPLQQVPPTQGTVHLPPAVGDRPGVSRIPGFEVDKAAGVGRMPTVRRSSALESHPFDLSQIPAPLFDKETAP